MEKEDLLPELVNTSWLLLIANEGILLNNPLVDLLLKIVQIHHHAVLAQGLTELRNKPSAYEKKEQGNTEERKGIKKTNNWREGELHVRGKHIASITNTVKGAPAHLQKVACSECACNIFIYSRTHNHLC